MPNITSLSWRTNPANMAIPQLEGIFHTNPRLTHLGIDPTHIRHLKRVLQEISRFLDGIPIPTDFRVIRFLDRVVLKDEDVKDLVQSLISQCATKGVRLEDTNCRLIQSTYT